MLSEPVLVVAKLACVFDALEIRYVVGGSLASSIYGIPRATQDVTFTQEEFDPCYAASPPVC